MSHRIHMPRFAAILAAVLLFAASLFLVASPAHAHDELVSSDPAADSTVETQPAALTFTFSGEIDPTAGATVIAVTDAEGAALVDGAPVVQDNVVTQSLLPGANGAVAVAWKVVSSDGHPISGEFSFTVAAPAPIETPTPTATAEPTPTDEPTETAAPVPPADGEDSTFADVWPWVVGGILVAALGGAVLYLLVSRARRDKALSDARTPQSDTPSDR